VSSEFALKLLPLTFVRPGELRLAESSHLTSRARSGEPRGHDEDVRTTSRVAFDAIPRAVHSFSVCCHWTPMRPYDQRTSRWEFSHKTLRNSGKRLKAGGDQKKSGPSPMIAHPGSHTIQLHNAGRATEWNATPPRTPPRRAVRSKSVAVNLAGQADAA
jgi:hypothetical protein